ncbi:Ig-like domain-containing protein [Pseudomonas sp. A-B-26]|uniref:Ig-like domain-containing protein n=1 Tax=Pseudomonas sp. A-B-26 TaxID=2832406 RepID=UPI001CBF666E|nr:Ig-like domain-containing protein [Pseudomonas sp. A-B-26]
MKADLTRSTDKPDQHYRAVRMQQGRVQLDADWNEQQDILNRRIESETVDTIGHSGGPLANPGFLLTGNGKNIGIGIGHYYVEGLLCENASQVPATSQPHLPGNVSPVLPANASLLPLPPANAPQLVEIKVYDNNGAPIDPPDGIYLGYLEAWLRHITALEDPLIREVALGGPDSATRDQLLWQVKLLRAGDIGADLNCLSALAAWTTLTTAADGKLAARAEPSTPPKDPCLLAPEAGYRRLENLLYRVEIHDDGSVSADQRYKWSRDNGSIETRVVRWLGEPTADEFEVASLGRDAYLAITAGCWLEFFDDTYELLGRPGTLVQVLKTEGNIVTLDLASATGSLDKALYLSNPRVRRWDGWAKLVPAAANLNSGWVELEEGVEIKFIPGKYRVGDFWTIPARTATADIEWPLVANKPAFQSPQGVLRAFTRLALLNCQAGVWSTLSDCRQLFPALTELTNLYYVGGDGQEVMPNPLAPQNLPLPSPLEVAVFNGKFPVAGAEVSFSVSDGTLPNGTASQIIATGADGIASVIWSLAPGVLNQTCTAQLLEAGQVAAGKYNVLHFSASLSVATQVAYDPAKCADMAAQGIHTVQDALDALCQKNHGGGCCTSVGVGGEFENLDIALKALLEQGQRDICLCLLPGEHHLADSIDQVAPNGTHLFIHGSGPASRLVLRNQEFNCFDFASLTFLDFDIVMLGENQCLRFQGNQHLRLQRMRLSGLTVPGISLVQIDDAQRIDLSACLINAYSSSGTQHARELFDAIPLLAPLEAAMKSGKGELFAPIPSKVVDAFAAFSAAQRKAFGQQVDRRQVVLNTDEILALSTLRSDIEQGASQRRLRLSLDRLRTELMLNHTGFALALGDAEADTLLADNQINGRVSLYGEAKSDEALDLDFLKNLGVAFSRGRVRLKPGYGELRLRNNRLQTLRLGDAMLDRLRQLAGSADGGEVEGCYRSLLADSNTLVGTENLLLALKLSLSQNQLSVFGHIAACIASQGKYIGNFSLESVLFVLGHNANQQFANAGLIFSEM